MKSDHPIDEACAMLRARAKREVDAAELGARLLEIDSWHGISPPLKDAIGWADEDMERAREERGNG